MVSNGWRSIQFALLGPTQTAANVELPQCHCSPRPPKPFISSHGSARLLAYPLRNRQSSMTAEPMKTKHIKITNRPAEKLPGILATFISWLLPALVLILTIESSQAESATWKASPFDGDWNFFDPKFGVTNWTGDVIPNGSADTATFDVSDTTEVYLSENTEV